MYGVADISVHARLVIRGLDKRRPESSVAFSIPVGEAAPFPYIDGRNGREQADDSGRVYRLRVQELVDLAPQRLPADVHARLRARAQRLEDLMALGSDAFVKIAVASSHARSGFRRTISWRARLANITEGEFAEDSVNLRDELPA